ncbi:hypothetical protein GCM10027053_28650 [Intrasporangium mesophilum]
MAGGTPWLASLDRMNATSTIETAPTPMTRASTACRHRRPAPAARAAAISARPLMACVSRPARNDDRTSTRACTMIVASTSARTMPNRSSIGGGFGSRAGRPVGSAGLRSRDAREGSVIDSSFGEQDRRTVGRDTGRPAWFEDRGARGPACEPRTI